MSLVLFLAHDRELGIQLRLKDVLKESSDWQ